MFGFDLLETLFVLWAFFFHIVLVVYFGLRKWKFDHAIRLGWIVYALSLPAVIVSVVLLMGGMAWSFWLGGFLYLVWGIFGYAVEFTREIKWRDPIRWSIFIPYVFLYLGTIMFYWWPLGQINRPLWFVALPLVIVGMTLNVTSHKISAAVHPEG